MRVSAKWVSGFEHMWFINMWMSYVIVALFTGHTAAETGEFINTKSKRLVLAGVVPFTITCPWPWAVQLHVAVPVLVLRCKTSLRSSNRVHVLKQT